MKFALKETKPTAEVEFEVEGGTLKFTIALIALDHLRLDYQGKDRTSERIRAALADAIVGWNLDREDGTPWECTPENKAKLIPDLVNRVTKEKRTAEDGTVTVSDGPLLGLMLLNFAADPENFLKN